MADNVLAALFQDQADAIREGLGDIGKIAPLDFPARTRDIVGLIGTGGSGGGSLPAGVYLSAYPIAIGIATKHRFFFLNGELYATGTGIAGNGYLSYIYKWNGSSWTTVLSASSSTEGISGTTVDGVGYRAVEYNGKMHFIDGVDHAVFDGSTFTNLNALPAKETTSVCVYQNKVVVYQATTGSMYEWDEVTDTWTVMAKISSNTYTYYYLHVINDVLYGIESKIVYKYVDGAMVQFKNEALTQFSSSATFVYDDCIYYIYSQKTRARLYRYNPLTGENVLVGNIPQFSNYYLTVGGNEISFVGVTNTSSTHHPCFVVNIIEETA